MTYDVDPKLTAAAITKAMTTEAEMSTVNGQVDGGADTAAGACHSSSVAAALNDLALRFKGEVDSVRNYYESMFNAGVSCINIFVTGDEEMARESFRADMRVAEGQPLWFQVGNHRMYAE